MSRTTEILEKAFAEFGASEEPEAPSKLEILLAESINLARLKKMAQRISFDEFVELFQEMHERYEATNNLFAYHSVLHIWDMLGPGDFEDSIQGREKALKAYKQLQLTLADLLAPEHWRTADGH